MVSINLPNPDRSVTADTLTGTPLALERRQAGAFPRIAYAAAHVVADPLASYDPWLTPAIDWETTLRFRHRLWDLGLGIAEAMDTAQRGMGLGWAEAQELIRRSVAEARTRSDALIAYGAGTDHLAPGPDVSLDDIIRAYEEQVGFVEGEGGLEQVTGGELDRGLLVQVAGLVVELGVRLVAEIDVEAEGHRERGEGRPHDGALGGGDDFVLVVQKAEVHPQEEGDKAQESEPQPDGLARVSEGHEFRHGKRVRMNAPRPRESEVDPTS